MQTKHAQLKVLEIVLQKSPLFSLSSTVSAADDVLLWEMVEYLQISHWG